MWLLGHQDVSTPFSQFMVHRFLDLSNIFMTIGRGHTAEPPKAV